MASQINPIQAKVKLNNGLFMPRLHLGVYLMSGNEAGKATTAALESGYRAIDSAQMYHNEKEVGLAVKSFLNANPNIKREDIHYTSKLASNSSYSVARKSIKKSVEASQLGYIDLFLLHSPYGGKQARLDSWKALEDAVLDGEVKIPGVSNYGEKHLQELLDSKPRIRPAVNQIEVHPFNTRADLCAYCREQDIVVEAYAPLARALKMKHPVLVALSKKYSSTPAQVMVRWSLQHGYVPLPKSVKRERIQENADVDKFHIDAADMEKLDSLDEYLVTDWDPTDAP